MQKQNKPIQGINSQITQLKDSIARNPVTESIEAGLMPTLVDDVETSVNKSYFPGDIEKFLTKQTDKLNPTVKNVGKVIFLAEDTTAYKMMNNAVKMTDFVGRHVLYTHLVETKGVKKGEAAAIATEEFVNFNLPTHRMVEYLNKLGLLMFTKYGIRVLKTVKGNAMERPYETITALLQAGAMGFDTTFGSIPGVTKGIFSNFANPFSTALSSAEGIAPVAMILNTISD